MGRDFRIDPKEFTSLKKHTAIVKIEDEVVKINTPKPCFPKKDYSEQIIQNNLKRYYKKYDEPKIIIEKDDLLTFDTLK